MRFGGGGKPVGLRSDLTFPGPKHRLGLFPRYGGAVGGSCSPGRSPSGSRPREDVVPRLAGSSAWAESPGGRPHGLRALKRAGKGTGEEPSLRHQLLGALSLESLLGSERWGTSTGRFLGSPRSLRWLCASSPPVPPTSADPPAPPFSVFQPPPPGCPPNAAQLAVMQGANVLVTQRKGNFFLGGSDGGYTIW